MPKHVRLVDGVDPKTGVRFSRTEIVETEVRQMTPDLAKAREMYHKRVGSHHTLRDAAAYIGMSPAEFSGWERSGQGLTPEQIAKLEALYG